MRKATRKQRYLDLMSAFPTGVGVVTGVDADERPQGMTCSSVASATVVPPTLLVCLRTGGATMDAVTAHNAFALNLLHENGRHAAEVFSRTEPDRFARVRWRRSRTGLPWLVNDAFAVAECVVRECVPVGDHMIVLGEVGTIARVSGTPLLYGQRRFAAWPARVPAESVPESVSDAEPVPDLVGSPPLTARNLAAS